LEDLPPGVQEEHGVLHRGEDGLQATVRLLEPDAQLRALQRQGRVLGDGLGDGALPRVEGPASPAVPHLHHAQGLLFRKQRDHQDRPAPVATEEGPLFLERIGRIVRVEHAGLPRL
jgi:hypothetical protein